MKNSFIACLPAEDLISFLQSLNRGKTQNEFITGLSSFIQDKPTPWKHQLMIKCSQSVNYWAACECNAQSRNESHLCQKRTIWWMHGAPRKLCVSHPRFMGLILAWRGRSSGEQTWKLLWNEHKIIAWSYWPYIYTEWLSKHSIW